MSNIKRTAEMEQALRALKKLSLEDCIRVLAQRIGSEGKT